MLKSVQSARRWRARMAGLAALLFMGGCAQVMPEPLTAGDHAERVASDLSTLFESQEAISGPLSLEEAIARALKYNLDRRLKLMEEAVSARQLDVANIDLLPDVVADAGYSTRSNSDTTFNEARTATSTTSDQTLLNADLAASWNILDFGIGYIRAQQQADLALIVRERRRQVVHNIIQDTRAAYWRAAAAERALAAFEPVTADVAGALEASDALVAEGLGALEALTYQRDLLRTLRQLEAIRRDLRTARSELAVLMNVHPGSDFELIGAREGFERIPSVPIEPDRLEVEALENRSELRSEAYQLRIAQREARVAMLRMVPGLSFGAGINYTSDSYKENQDWADGSLSLTWNIMQIFAGPRRIDLAETEQQLSETRRLALSMAVIAQSNISKLRLAAAKRDFELAGRLADVEGRIGQQLAAQGQAAGGERRAILGRVDKALADLRRDLAYADLQAAYGQLIATLGADPLVAPAASDDLEAVTQAVARTLAAWERGEFAAPDEPYGDPTGKLAAADPPVSERLDAAIPVASAPAARMLAEPAFDISGDGAKSAEAVETAQARW